MIENIHAMPRYCLNRLYLHEGRMTRATTYIVVQGFVVAGVIARSRLGGSEGDTKGHKKYQFCCRHCVVQYDHAPGVRQEISEEFVIVEVREDW